MKRNTSTSILAVSIATGAVVCLAFLIMRVHAQADDIFSDWRPNTATRGVKYLGSKACVQCHPGFASQLGNPMAQALEAAPDCRLFKGSSRLTFRNGSYTYEILREGQRTVYAVSNGSNTISTPILFCFGQGHIGQTYFFRYNDVLYETRVSYFQKTRGLDFTIGHRRSVPTSLEDSLGRRIGRDEAQLCLGVTRQVPLMDLN